MDGVAASVSAGGARSCMAAGYQIDKNPAHRPLPLPLKGPDVPADILWTS